MEKLWSQSGDRATAANRVCSFSLPVGWEPHQSARQVTGGPPPLVTAEQRVSRFTSAVGPARMSSSPRAALHPQAHPWVSL